MQPIHVRRFFSQQTLDAQLNLFKSLYEGIHSSQGGEVIVKKDDLVGRIYIVGGEIAWIMASAYKTTFMDHLVSQRLIERDTLMDVLQACRCSNANFAQTLIDWNLLGRETVHGELMNHLVHALCSILLWKTFDSMFVPVSRIFRGKLTYPLECILRRLVETDPSLMDLNQLKRILS